MKESIQLSFQFQDSGTKSRYLSALQNRSPFPSQDCLLTASILWSAYQVVLESRLLHPSKNFFGELNSSYLFIICRHWTRRWFWSFHRLICRVHRGQIIPSRIVRGLWFRCGSCWSLGWRLRCPTFLACFFSSLACLSSFQWIVTNHENKQVNQISH